MMSCASEEVYRKALKDVAKCCCLRVIGGGNVALLVLIVASALVCQQTWIFFFSPTPSLGPLHTRTHTTKDVGGRSSLGPADAVGTVRLMPFLPDDASSPSQAN